MHCAGSSLRALTTAVLQAQHHSNAMELLASWRGYQQQLQQRLMAKSQHLAPSQPPCLTILRQMQRNKLLSSLLVRPAGFVIDLYPHM